MKLKINFDGLPAHAGAAAAASVGGLVVRHRKAVAVGRAIGLRCTMKSYH
jgi:hypothetical protein